MSQFGKVKILMQETMQKIRDHLEANNTVEWDEVKAVLDYTEYPKMLKAVRQLERDGFLKREPYHTPQGSGLRIHKVV